MARLLPCGDTETTPRPRRGLALHAGRPPLRPAPCTLCLCRRRWDGEGVFESASLGDLLGVAMQILVEELMTWHASLLHSMIERQNHPDMANARKPAALDQKEWHILERHNGGRTNGVRRARGVANK